ncbi:MAG: helix-turn-helix domain-containing protein [Minisyncoccia bacterium]
MAYPSSMRHEAVRLRKRGYSLKELSERLGVVKSTIALWTEDVVMDKKAEQRLLTVIKRGQFVSGEKRRARTKATEDRYFKEAQEEIKSNPNYNKIVCAMIYWCEGAKSAKGGIAFTNSDPNLVRTFLRLLRECFDLDESKFHPCIHLHSYHSPEKQLDFWSKVTDINKQQFIKPYLKPNTGKRVRENYQGCIRIRYGSNDLARKLMAVAKAYLSDMGA